jgi:two-component system chemotaxis sensor kinase CheA
MRDVTLEETLQRKYRREFEQKEAYIKELEQAKEALADYSKNLEIKVQERTAELASANRTMKALLESLGQGFFIFDQEGVVSEIATKACLSVLEKDPRGMRVWDVLGLKSKEIESFKKWSQTLFLELLPFEDLVPLGPAHYSHTEKRSIQLSYHPLRGDEQEIIGIVVVATDVTDLVQAQEQAQKEKAYAQLVLKLTHNKKQFGMFYREAQDWIDRIRQTSKAFEESPDELFRALHSLKGGASSFSLLSVAHACHEAESILASDQLSQEEKKSSLAKVVLKIEEEFRNFKLEFDEFLKRIDEDQGPIKEISESKIIQFGERFLAFNSNVQYHFYFEFLFDSIGSCLEGLNNPWAEVAGQFGKEVAPIEFINPHFQIWPRPYEALFNTLIHAVRNAADHAIELPEDRIRLGKPREGHLTIDVRSESQFFIMKIADDGAGIATDRLRLKLKELGVEQIDSLSDYEVNQYIFWPQLSLKEKVTEISGRGVGMDAIKDEAIKLGGRVWVNSTPHRGTEVNIEVPFIQPGSFYQGKKNAS